MVNYYCFKTRFWFITIKKFYNILALYLQIHSHVMKLNKWAAYTSRPIRNINKEINRNQHDVMIV